MSIDMFVKRQQQAEARIQRVRRALREKRRAREQLITRVADEPSVAGTVAQLDGEISVLREAGPALVAARDEARRNLSSRRRLEEKQKEKEKQPV